MMRMRFTWSQLARHTEAVCMASATSLFLVGTTLVYPKIGWVTGTVFVWLYLTEIRNLRLRVRSNRLLGVPTTMRFFGPTLWGSALLDPSAAMSGTPAQPCLHCHEGFDANDYGIVLPHVGPEGMSFVSLHRECQMRALFGSVGHQQGQCACYGGTQEDPPGMTAREAAKAAYALYEMTHATNTKETQH